MITIRNWIPTIPEEDKHIAYVGEGESVERVFFVTGEGWEKFRDWTYHLDMAFDLSGVMTCDSRKVVLVKEDATVCEPDMQNKITSKTTSTETYTVDTVDPGPYPATDIAYLYKEVKEDGLYLHWNVLRQHTQVAGKLTANLRALGPEEEVKKSAIMVFEVDPAVQAVPAATVTESEFEQMEQRMAQVCEELRALQMDIADNAEIINTKTLEVQQSAVQSQQYATTAAALVEEATARAEDTTAAATDAQDSATLAQNAAAKANEYYLQVKGQVNTASSAAANATKAEKEAKSYSTQAAAHANTASTQASAATEQTNAAKNYASSAQTAAQNAATAAQTTADNLTLVQQSIIAAEGKLVDLYDAVSRSEEAAQTAQESAESANQSQSRTEQIAMALENAVNRLPPTFSAEESYYILRVKYGGNGLEFVNINQDMYIKTWVLPYLLPVVYDEDNGKTLRVVNGKWALVDP